MYHSKDLCSDPDHEFRVLGYAFKGGVQILNPSPLDSHFNVHASMMPIYLKTCTPDNMALGERSRAKTVYRGFEKGGK